MSFVSCIMPVYNCEDFLSDAIQSILDQTYDQFELIIINDGSTDGSRAIIEEFASRDDRVIMINQCNQGIVGALNAGLNQARGDLLARMDADDIALPHRFDFQRKYLADHPECVLVGGYAEAFSSMSNKTSITTGGWRTTTDLAAFPPKIAVSVHPLIMTRTESIRRAGGYRAMYCHAEDYDLFIRLAKYGEIHNPPNVVLRYRAHAMSDSSKNTETQEWMAIAAEFDAMQIRLPHPPRDAKIPAYEAVPGEHCEKSLPDALVYAYFWFRVWRRYRGTANESRVFRKLLGFLFGISPSAWGYHYGIALRKRILGSILMHSSVVNKARDYLRQRTAAGVSGATA